MDTEARGQDLQLLGHMAVIKRDLQVVDKAITAYDDLQIVVEAVKRHTKDMQGIVQSPTKAWQGPSMPLRDVEAITTSERDSIQGFIPTSTEVFGAPSKLGKRKCSDREVQQEKSKKMRLDHYEPETKPAQIGWQGNKLKKQELRQRRVLPMKLRRESAPPSSLDIFACPDSGSIDNIMSLATAQSLGCCVEPSKPNEEQTFALANGTRMMSLGRVVTECSFAEGTPWEGSRLGFDIGLECVFHVFRTLAVPLIMGMSFLERTETLSRFTDRLVNEPMGTNPLSMVNSVGAPTKSLIC